MENYNNFTLNLKNLNNNVEVIKQKIGNSVMLCAMVKANAYSHGIAPICKELQNKVDFFGVATVMEAKEIRKLKISTPILVVGLASAKAVNWCSKNNVSLTVNSLLELKNYAKKLKQNKLKIHFKINTGLNRIGFSSINEFLLAFDFAKQNKNFVIEGLFTHFATKVEDEEFVVKQHNDFLSFVNKIDSSYLIVHCCNSYAIGNFKSFHHNMVRCGFSLFGWESGESYLPVLTVTAKVLAIQNVNQGETVGYDRTFVAPNRMKIAVVSMGYADGFDRRNSNLTSVLINDQSAKVVGLVCMDVFMLDITNLKHVKVGTSVTILGKCKEKTLSPHYYANLLKTSPYEVLLKFNCRRMNVKTII